ncbi:MAG: extracellular solute-binding protein [Betaproteobacteria bacterium]
MHGSIRPLIAVMAIAFSASALAAKPAKVPKSKKQQPAAVKPEVALSHPFGQAAEVELQKLVDRFNEKNPGTPIKLVRLEAGSKPTALNILRRTQVAEDVAAKAGFKPLYAVMKEAGEKFDSSRLSADLRAGVTDEKGRFVGLPVAYSTPVLFYNKNAFRKAKLDPEKAPATWQEMQDAAGKLRAAGYDCPYTTSWPTWVHIDNVSALSGAPVTNGKGELVFNGLVQVKHIAKLATWKQAGYFVPSGRKNEGDEKFRNGECAMVTTDSSAHTDFRDAKGVELGVAPLPNYDDIYGGRQHTLAEGPSLWFGANRTAAEYKVAAKFVTFLLSPEMQVEFANIYGQLPLTEAARVAMKSQALRDRGQTLEVAYASMKGKGAVQPVRVSTLDPVRIILDEELEKVWSDGIPPKLALDTAVTRGNAILKAKPALRKPVPF